MRRLHPMLTRAVAAAIFLLTGTNALAQDLPPTSQMAERWVQDVYRPVFHDFAIAANRWVSSSENLCQSARGSRIYQLQTEFTELVADYAKVEVFRSGPLLENNRRNRLFYWPDSRRVGERQLRSLLASSEAADLSIQQLSQKSVALQGFPALERLLFNNSYQAVETPPQCHVVRTIIQNIALMANQLDRDWQNESDFVQAFMNPVPTSEYFRNDDEVIRTVITEVVMGLDSLIDRKLLPLLSGDPSTIRTTPLWQSQRTVAMLNGNVSSIRALLFDVGLLEQMGLIDELEIDFLYVNNLLEKLKYRYGFADDTGQLHEEVDLIFTSLSAALNSIRYTVKQQVLVPLGIGVGFNAEDGD